MGGVDACHLIKVFPSVCRPCPTQRPLACVPRLPNSRRPRPASLLPSLQAVMTLPQNLEAWQNQPNLLKVICGCGAMVGGDGAHGCVWQRCACLASRACLDGGYLNLKARHVLNLITRPKKKYEEDLEDQNQVYWMLQRLYDPETPVASLELQVSRGA